MEKIHSVEEGVRKLLTIRERQIPDFTLIRKGAGDLTDRLRLNGSGDEIPLPYWQYDSRIRGIYRYAMQNKQKICVLNAYSFSGHDLTFEQLLYRELDTAELILHAKIKKVTAFQNQNAMNLIAVTDKGTVANIDLANTMASGATIQCQHRLITQDGMANDRVVDNQTVSHSIYLFTEDAEAPEVYDDIEYYLYGLGYEDATLTVYLNALLAGNLKIDAIREKDTHIRAVLAATLCSAREGNTQTVRETEGAQ